MLVVREQIQVTVLTLVRVIVTVPATITNQVLAYLECYPLLWLQCYKPGAGLSGVLSVTMVTVLQTRCWLIWSVIRYYGYSATNQVLAYLECYPLLWLQCYKPSAGLSGVLAVTMVTMLQTRCWLIWSVIRYYGYSATNQVLAYLECYPLLWLQCYKPGAGLSGVLSVTMVTVLQTRCWLIWSVIRYYGYSATNQVLAYLECYPLLWLQCYKPGAGLSGVLSVTMVTVLLFSFFLVTVLLFSFFLVTELLFNCYCY